MQISTNARTPLALGLAATLLLAGCSGGDEGEPQADETSTSPSVVAASESEEPYLKVPVGTELTTPGEALELGETATVAFRTPKTAKTKAGKTRKGKKTGVVDVTVQRIDKGNIKDLVAFKLGKKFKKSTPYYVRAKVENVGNTNLAGALPPLYVEDGKERLVQASQFQSVFKTCPSPALPKGFKKGKKTTGCWVYLISDGKAQAVSFYPLKGFVPIEWSGAITQPKGTKKSTKKANNKKASDKKTSNTDNKKNG